MEDASAVASSVSVDEPAASLDPFEPVGSAPASAPTGVGLWLRRGLDLLGILADVVFGAAFLTVFGAVIANVFARTVLSHALIWTSDISGLCVPVMAFIGGARAYGMGRATAFTGLVDRLSGLPRDAASALANLWVLGVAAVVGWEDRTVVTAGGQQHSPILRIPSNWVALGLQVALILTCLYAIRNVLVLPWRARVIGLGGAVVAALVLWGAIQAVGSYATPGHSSAVALGTFAVAYLVGVPIIYVLLTSALIYVHVSGVSQLQVVPSNMISGVSGYLIVAIPFFVLAGTLLGQAGMTQALGRLLQGLLARVKGGLLHGTVLMMYVFSGISGSKIADIAAVGTALREPVLESGIEAEEMAAVLAASAVMGESVPPSTVMLVLGSITTVSIGGLFKAGLLPAAVIGVLIMALVFVRAARRPPAGIDVPVPSRRRIGRDALESLPAVAIPIFILVAIYTGFVTPTEASSIAVAVGVLVAVAMPSARRRLSLGLLRSAESTAGFVMSIIAAATAFSFTLSVAGFPTLVTDLFNSFGGSKLSVLLLSVVLLPILGSVLEGLPAILILGPLLVPVAEHAGINLLQYSILLVLAIGLGTFAPPLGVGMFSTCAVTETTVAKVSRHFWPYGLVILGGLFLLAFVPSITTVVPNWLGTN